MTRYPHKQFSREHILTRGYARLSEGYVYGSMTSPSHVSGLAAAARLLARGAVYRRLCVAQLASRCRVDGSNLIGVLRRHGQNVRRGETEARVREGPNRTIGGEHTGSLPAPAHIAAAARRTGTWRLVHRNSSSRSVTFDCEKIRPRTLRASAPEACRGLYIAADILWPQWITAQRARSTERSRVKVAHHQGFRRLATFHPFIERG